MKKLMIERGENSMKLGAFYCSRFVVDGVVDSVVDFENLSMAEIFCRRGLNRSHRFPSMHLQPLGHLSIINS
jgi:hypothetical protein